MCTKCAAPVGHCDSSKVIVKFAGNRPYCKVNLAVGDRGRYGSSHGLGRSVRHCSATSATPPTSATPSGLGRKSTSDIADSEPQHLYPGCSGLPTECSQEKTRVILSIGDALTARLSRYFGLRALEASAWLLWVPPVPYDRRGQVAIAG